MIHQLKTEAQYFDDVTSGRKPFEVRLNDRDFMAGDYLALNELTLHKVNDRGDHKETGRCCLVEITYVLTDARFVRDGYAILGIRPCCIGSRGSEINRYESFYTVPVYGSKEATS